LTGWSYISQDSSSLWNQPLMEIRGKVDIFSATYGIRDKLDWYNSYEDVSALFVFSLWPMQNRQNTFTQNHLFLSNLIVWSPREHYWVATKTCHTCPSPVSHGRIIPQDSRDSSRRSFQCVAEEHILGIAVYLE